MGVSAWVSQVEGAPSGSIAVCVYRGGFFSFSFSRDVESGTTCVRL